MALRAHETLAAAGTAVGPATTAAQLMAYGAGAVLCSTTADVRFTVDGLTNPVITASSEVGTLLRSTDLGIMLTPEEFLNSKWLDVSTDARIQFEFLTDNFRRFG